METGGSAGTEGARPATVADVQRIVSEAQKETQQSLENVLKALSERLAALSTEHQASAPRKPALPEQLPSAAEALRRDASVTKYGRSVTGQSTAFSELSEQPVNAAAGASAQQSSDARSGKEAFSELSEQPVNAASGASAQQSSDARSGKQGSQARSGKEAAVRLPIPQRESWPARSSQDTAQGSARSSICESVPERESWSTRNSKEIRYLPSKSNLNIANALGFGSVEEKVKSVQSPISSTASRRLEQERTSMERALRSPVFENVCGVVILANAVMIGVHANSRAMYPTGFCENTWFNLFLLFQVFFTLEIIFRIVVTKSDFFCGLECRWNLFDLFIVVAGVAEEIIQRSIASEGCSAKDITKGFTAVRVIRVLRLVRILRVVKTMAIFHDFRVMASSILRCLIPLCWACILLLFIQWVFGVYFVHLVADHVQGEFAAVSHNSTAAAELLESDEYEKFEKYYGSLWLAMYTLFGSVTGGLDWSDAANSLPATGSFHPAAVYILFIALTTFAVLNVVTGVFVENATKMALHDREFIIHEKLQHRETYMKDALAVFKEADSDGSGLVSYQEFEDHLGDVRVQAFFSCLELDTVEARRLFRLMDFDGNGTIDPQEFVAGCMYLKGEAKTMDVVALLREVRRMSEFWGQCMDHLDHEMQQLSAGVHELSYMSV